MSPAEHHARFEDWLRHHAAILHHVAHGFAEGADRHDLFQELLLALWHAIPAFRGGAQPSTFIYRVAHNTALTWRRTQQNYRARLDRFGTDATVVPTLAAESSPAHPADTRQREALEHLYAAIRQLPPLDRSLILLHLDGVAYAEIGELHGLTETNVGARLTRAKQRLTAALAAITHELR